jgi:hypothetical protein
MVLSRIVLNADSIRHDLQLLSKPINRLQTEAAKSCSGATLKDGRQLQASWDGSLIMRVPLLAMSLLAQCLTLMLPSA